MSSRFIMPFADVGSGIKPSSGAKLYFFEVDGVTPKNTFSDQLSTPTPNTNPVISDSNGVFGDIYIDGKYKVTLEDKNGSQIFGGAIVDDISSDIINDLSLPYVSDTVADYKAFATVFPVGKVVKLLDRDAEFTIISGTVTANDANIIASSTTGQSISLITGMVLHAKQWGAIDGSDNTAVLQEMSSFLSSYTIVDLGSIEHVISASGTPASPYGHRVFDLDNKDGVQFVGGRARVKVVNHDIATNGGLSFIWAKASNGLSVKGIDFDMSFINAHTSSTQYPWCSAILGNDESNATAGGVRTQAQLNGNWQIEDCTFKMFHPWGQFAQSGSAYLGDPNNGFKIFPCTVLGPFDAVEHINQCRKITFENCTFKEGGNSYGFWAWAWNDVSMINCTAESFVSKQSGPTGIFSGRGEPMLRYHQFHCSGVTVSDNHFRAKPCSERTVAGFEGDARFIDYNTNLLGNYSHGVCTITGNTIIGGRGDAANTMDDWYINLTAYGSITITGNSFGSTSETTNAQSSIGILWNSEAIGGQGNAALSIIGNDWNAECDYMDNISISNGGSTAANRRLKTLIVEDNTTLGQYQYFVKMAATNTAYGVADCRINHNNISGEFNVVFDKNSSNSRAIEVSGSEATDNLDLSKNITRDKYYGVETNGYSGTAHADSNRYTGVTNKYLLSYANFITTDRGAGATAETPASGSVYYRTDGAPGTLVFVRNGGVWTSIG